MNLIEYEDKVDTIVNHYEPRGGLHLFGLNDSQGVCLPPIPFKRTLLGEVSYALNRRGLVTNSIDAFSLLLNKTEHVDQMLKYNFSVEQIKASQVKSAILSLSKALSENGYPAFLGRIANIYKMNYGIKPGDREKFISTELRKSTEPVVIYSCGANDLMRAVGSDPLSLLRTYKEAHEGKDSEKREYAQKRFNYSIRRASDHKTVDDTIDAVKRNFDTILGVNNDARIVALKLFVPQTFFGENIFFVFREMIENYNNKLSEVCSEYGVSTVDTQLVSIEHCNGEGNFHNSPFGNQKIAQGIISAIGDSIITPKEREIKVPSLYIPEESMIQEAINECQGRRDNYSIYAQRDAELRKEEQMYIDALCFARDTSKKVLR